MTLARYFADVVLGVGREEGMASKQEVTSTVINHDRMQKKTSNENH